MTLPADRTTIAFHVTPRRETSAAGTPNPKARNHTMHFENHQSVIDDLEARILTIRDSL